MSHASWKVLEFCSQSRAWKVLENETILENDLKVLEF